MGNINKIGAAYGLHVERGMMPIGMAIPVLGMVLGTLVAVFISYRKPRIYADRAITPVTTIDLDKPLRATVQDETADLKADAEELKHEAEQAPVIAKKTIFMALLAIGLTLVAQLYSGSMILGGLVGFAILSTAGIFNGKMQMMCCTRYANDGSSRLYYDLCCRFCISHDAYG